MKPAPSRLVAVAAILSITGSVCAQWTSDPSLNTPISTESGIQDLCKVAPTSDGGCWIAWFSSVPAPTNYNVRIQRLNAAGVGQLGANGMLVSANPSASFTAGEWDLRTDSSNNALLIFNDLRGGSDREISAYRIAPDGTQLWGADGIQLSNDTVDEFDSRICQTSDGNFAAVWSRNNSGTTPPRGLVMQRLDSAGTKLLAADGVLIAGSGVGGAGAADGPGFFQMVPAENGSVIVSYLKDTRSFSSPRYPTIQKYDTSGAGLWNSGSAITLMASAVPISYYMNLVADGANGAIVTWHDNRRAGAFDCWVQRFDSAGTAAFAAGGVATSINNVGRLHVDPTVGILGPTGEIYVFWSERDGSQGTRAVYGQKIDSTGARAWTDAGYELTPFDTEIESFIRGLPLPSPAPGAVCIFKSTPTGSTSDTVQALRVDGDGDAVWTPNPVVMCSVGSSKGRFPSAALSDGGLVSVWSDTRTDGGDIYAQRINVDGTLGAPPASCPADFNNSGEVTVQDIFDFLASYFVSDPLADFNHSGGLSVQDIFDFLGAYFTGCP